MANQNGHYNGVEIPALKTEEKERRGAAPPVSLIGGSGAGGGPAAFSFLGRVLPFLTSGVGMTVVTSLGVGTIVYGLYTVNMAAQAPQGAPDQPSIFASRSAGQSSYAPSRPSGSSSLGYFERANKGALDEVSLEGQVQGETKGQGDASIGDTAAPSDSGKTSDAVIGQTAPPSTSNSGAPSGLKSMNIGRLSSSIGQGNGLAGGGGMAGGLVQQFKKGNFDGSPGAAGKPGQVLAMRPQAATAQVTRASVTPVTTGSKGAMGQLKKSSAESMMGSKSSAAEGSSYHSAEAFTGAPAAQASSNVGGSGVSGGGTATSGEGMAEGPINPNDNTTASNPNQPAPSTGTSDNATPWQSSVVMAQTLLMVASGIILLLSMLPSLLKGMFGTILKGIAAGLAGTATALGVMIMTKYGQQEQGMILTTGGAITTAAAGYALVASNVQSWPLVLGGIGGMAASIGSMLAKTNISSLF